MSTAILIIAAVALLGYDPAKVLYKRWQAKRAVEPSPDYVVIDNPDPSRLEAFKAAETLTAYFDSIGHASGIATSRAAAQWLFAESEE
jgi:carbamoylphosphate synthase large subunit